MARTRRVTMSVVAVAVAAGLASVAATRSSSAAGDQAKPEQTPPSATPAAASNASPNGASPNGASTPPSAPGATTGGVPDVAPASAKDPVERGRFLTLAADCGPCHSGPGQPAYSGGYYMKTPFGSIASPNITPDDETGIGKWSEADFKRVMHEGVGKQGEYIYPMMPFPWYTKISDQDVHDMWLYLRSLKPEHAPRKPTELAFPFSIREGMLAWRTAFFHPGRFQPDPKQTDEINRGSYLVNALEHCSECHGDAIFGNSSFAKPFEGGKFDNWYAPNITNASTGVGSWSEDQLYQFFKKGVVEGKTVAIGPMREVVHSSLSQLPDADLHAIAAYMKSIKPAESEKPEHYEAYAGDTGPGAEVYLNHCASCHQRNGEGVAGEVPPLKGNGAVTAAGPQNVIRAVLQGVVARENYRVMPALGADMTDQQIADVTNYVRNSWGNASVQSAGGGDVGEIRAEAFIPLSPKTPTCYPPGEPPTPDATLKTLMDPKSGVIQAMQQVKPDDMINQIGVIVDKAKAVAPHEERGPLVNDLMHAYCTVIKDAQGVELDQKRWYYNNFAQIAYGQLAHPEKTVQNTK